MSFASGNAQDNIFNKYVDSFHELDERRKGLDFEIQELVDDLDHTEFDKLSPQTSTVESFKADSKVR